MRYRVEFLVETTEEDSVCHTIDADGHLDGVELLAFARSGEMKLRHGAEGFQIRDLTDRERIVALETFDNPLTRFAPGDHIIH
ncbi:hypothetical protein [Terricaulis sp.]|uniref:hypothetical protein n=1 Tax=Terricaulis sp. TaxID=2768686 RepID=UPI0037833C4D